MDPNANLAEQEQLLSDIQGADTDEERRDFAAELHVLRRDLREWLARGGFEPDWSKHPAAARYYGH